MTSPGAALREWSSLIGIVTAIIGNVLISFALNLQRYAHIELEREQKPLQTDSEPNYGSIQSQMADQRALLNRTASLASDSSLLHRLETGENSPSKLIAGSRSRSLSETTIRPARPKENRKTYLRSPYWWGGIVLMTVGEAGNFLAYGFAPASIVSPLGVVALVSNCLVAPLLLKERFRQRDFWGVVIAIAGAVTVVLSAKTSEDKMGPDDILTAITQWEFELYLGITAVIILGLLWASSRYGHKTLLIDLGLVGLFGGYTALSTKGIASLLSDTLWRALTFPITYVLLLILVMTALLQIRYVNRALQRFDSTRVIPVQFVLFTISVIIGSAILYRDFESATVDRIAKFVGGCLLTFAGVYLLTSGRTEAPSAQSRQSPGIKLVDDEQESLGHDDTSTRSDKHSPASQSHTEPQRPSGPSTSASTPLLPTVDASLTPTRPSRPGTLSRRSIALLSPGPLTAPLSSSLSAVVADQRRRAISSMHGSNNNEQGEPAPRLQRGRSITRTLRGVFGGDT